MKRLPTTLALALAVTLAAGAAVPARAQTLRWTSQGDLLTLDPHAQNEGLNNAMNGQVYEYLVARDKQLNLVPALATEWRQTGPLQWRMKLRPNVKFHDGTPFGADDVVFSFRRAKEPTSQIAVYAKATGEVRKVDDLTVEFNLAQVNPIFLQHVNTVFIMSRAWSERHRVTRPLDFKNKEESFASYNANGTGPFMLVKREPDVKTSYRRNPNWWGKPEGNVQEVVYTPIKQDATRLAALISGEIDFVLDPPLQDLERLKRAQNVAVLEGPEVRTIFFAMDTFRDELLYSSVRGRNPLKDVRVRQALYQAINIDAIKARVMRGQSIVTGTLFPPQVNGYAADQDVRLPYDQARARALLAEAGYPQGFEITLDCPNNRYINDEQICQAVAAMWAAVGVKTNLNAMPLQTFFPKIQKDDTSLYLLGWGVPTLDALYSLQSLVMSRTGRPGDGIWNYGRYSNPRMDALIEQIKNEGDKEKRDALIRDALVIYREDVPHIPLHHQMIPWATRTGFTIPHMANNQPMFRWMKVN